MKKLTIRCSADWIRSYVMEKGTSEPKPMEIMQDYICRLELNDGEKMFQLLDASYYHVSAAYSDEIVDEAAISLLSGIMKQVFELTDEALAENVRFVVEELPQEEPDEAAGAEEDARFSQEEPARLSPDEILNRIRSLKGADQFIALCEEIHTAAPLLRERKLEDVFRSRSYLFSIDIGSGVGRSVSEFTELAVSEGLIPSDAGICFEKLPVEVPREGISLSEETAMQLSRGMQVLLVDITAWIDRMDDPAFRNYLYLLSQVQERAVYVFRVPYLEQSELERISAALSDLLTVQTVVFVPITSEDLQDIALQSLQERGFEATEEVWDLFQQRIAEEKSDGYFYGVQTVKKIVNEMIYQQVRTIAMNEKADKLQTICAESLRQFVRSDPGGISAEEELSRLIGVDKVSAQIHEILNQIEFAAGHEGVEKPMMHMRFVGNPGTGKTTVARILGRMLRERGLLSKGYFYEHAGGDLIASYVGQTAPKVASICRDAYGSVLFIDEAYTLANANYRAGGFAKEAVDALIAQMENHREDFMVILAGYPADMDRLMNLNAGFAGRVPYVIEFPNYSREELAQIFMVMLQESMFRAGEGLEDAVRAFFLGLDDSIMESENFSNARFVRNIFEKTWSKTVMRAQIGGSPEAVVTVEDFQSAVREDVHNYLDKTERIPRPGFHLGLL